MTWLVTGGAGYIGAHVVRAFQEQGIDVVVVDDLSSGHREFVPNGVPLYKGSIFSEPEKLTMAFAEHDITGVVHLAGFKAAGVSVTIPAHTYEQNVIGTMHLLGAMEKANVTKLVFSSSAAVFGTPHVDLVTETTPTNPESPYGQTKLIGEWMIANRARVAELAGTPEDFLHTSLRYFNVVGSGYPEIFDTSAHNLFPLVFNALLEGRVPQIFGDDYNTPDGTNVRDYIHVGDLARAHVVAAVCLEKGVELEQVYNLGSGDGLSVKQVMDAIRQVTGIDFTPNIGPRRPGDPDRIVASGELAARDLEWGAQRATLTEMVSSAWNARKAADAPSL